MYFFAQRSGKYWVDSDLKRIFIFVFHQSPSDQPSSVKLSQTQLDQSWTTFRCALPAMSYAPGYALGLWLAARREIGMTSCWRPLALEFSPCYPPLIMTSPTEELVACYFKNILTSQVKKISGNQYVIRKVFKSLKEHYRIGMKKKPHLRSQIYKKTFGILMLIVYQTLTITNLMRSWRSGALKMSNMYVCMFTCLYMYSRKHLLKYFCTLQINL